MSEMIERVAKAIAASGLSLGYDTNETADRAVLIAARAAIEAMREPTEAMLKAVDVAEEKEGYCAAAFETMAAAKSWPVMIDAALSPDVISTAVPPT